MSWADLTLVDFSGGFWDLIWTIPFTIFVIYIYAFLSYLQAGLFLGFIGVIKQHFIDVEAKIIDKFHVLALMLIFSLFTFRSGEMLLSYLFFSGDIANEIVF